MEKATIKMILEELNNVYDEDLEKFGRTIDCAYDLIRMILNGTDVPASIALNLIKNDYDRHQYYELMRGLEYNVDISVYADPIFDEYRMGEILEGLMSGVDVSIYADPKYTSEQMKEIRQGLEEGLDVSFYADPNLSVREMLRIRGELLKSLQTK